MKLQAWMKKATVSDEELARRVGIARETANRLRRRKLVPSLKLAARIYYATDRQVRPLDLIDTDGLDLR